MPISSLFKKKDPYTTVNQSLAQKSSSPYMSTQKSVNYSSPYQSTVKPQSQATTTNPAQNMSVYKPQIQGSGMTSNYVSNPTNYKPKTTPQPAQPQPQPAQPQANPTDALMAPTNSFLEAQKRASQEQLDYEAQQRKAAEDAITQQFNIANESLRGQIPELEGAFNLLKTNTQAGLEQLAKQAELQKSTIGDYYGDAQLRAARARQQSQANTTQKFAAQGAVDSGGAGSYQSGMENVDSEFNRVTQGYLKEKAAKLSEIESQLFTAQSNAQTLLAQEESKLRQNISTINSQLANNDVARGEAIRQAYAQTQERIFAIQDSLRKLEYSAQVEKMNIENEIASMGQADQDLAGLSETFLTTGKPATYADYIYSLKNPKNAADYQGVVSGGQGGKKTEKQTAYEAAGVIASNALQKLKSGSVESGVGQGILGKLGERLGFNTDQQQSYRSDIAAMRTAIQNALLGANMSPKEMDQVMAAIPQYGDDPRIAEQKLNSLITNLPILAGNTSVTQNMSYNRPAMSLNQLASQFGY